MSSLSGSHVHFGADSSLDESIESKDSDSTVIEGHAESVQIADVNAQDGNLLSRVSKAITRAGALSALVRFVGVAALVLSMFLFLLEGMSIVNDTQRFFTMLILTVLLGVGGVLLAFVLREQRGARSFFGLALLSVPVNFTVLGALLYSVFRLDAVTTDYPTLAEWTLTSATALGTTALISLLVLIPITFFSLSIVARELRGWLFPALLASCAVLLLPVRDTMWIAPVVALVVAALLWVVGKKRDTSIVLKTPGGRFAQSLLFLPPLIMLVRSIWLYDVSALAATVVSLTLYIVGRVIAGRVDFGGIVKSFIYFVVGILALFTSVFAGLFASDYLSEHYIAISFSLILVALLIDFERVIRSSEKNQLSGLTLVYSGYALLASVAFYNHIIFEGSLMLGVSMLILVPILSIAILHKDRMKLLIGGAGLAALVTLNIGGLVELFKSTGWIGFALLGATAIIFSSVLDRYGVLYSFKFAKHADIKNECDATSTVLPN